MQEVSGIMATMAVVDLSPFTSRGDIESRKKAAKQLAERVCVNGSVGISGHGMSAEELKDAFNIAKQLFDIPYEKKMKAPHPDGPTPHRGYSSIGRERAANKTALEGDKDASKVEEEPLNTSDYKVNIPNVYIIS